MRFILSLYDDPDQGRIGVTLDVALTMMALGDGSEGDSERRGAALNNDAILGDGKGKR